MIVWGVDLDVRAAHIARYDTETGEHLTDSCTWEGDAKHPVRRLCACRSAVESWVVRSSSDWWPDTVAVERPTGKYPSPSLMMHAGVVAEALAHALGMAPWFLSVSEWRKAAGLAGNSNKDQVVRWARSFYGFTGLSVDQAEALGVAVAASRIWSPA